MRREPRSCFTTSARQQGRRPTSPRTRASCPEQQCRHLGLYPAAEEGLRRRLRGAERDPVPRSRRQPGVRLECRRPGAGRLHRGSDQDRLDPLGHADPGRGHLRRVGSDAPAGYNRRAPTPRVEPERRAPWQLLLPPRRLTQASPAVKTESPRQSSVRRTRPLGGDPDGGVPTILHVTLIWIPTIVSIFLSFTSWRGIRFSELKWVGLKNYHQIFTVFQKNFYQALINNTVLLVFLFVFPTVLGMLHRYLLDRDIRGTRIFQSVFFTPVVLSLAVVGFMWQSVIYSTENGLATQIFGHGGDQLAREPVLSDSASAKTTEFRRTSWRSWSRSPGGTPATSWCSTWPA